LLLMPTLLRPVIYTLSLHDALPIFYARKPLLNHMNISWFRAADEAGAAPSALARWPAMLSWRGAWEGAVMTPGRRFIEVRDQLLRCREDWTGAQRQFRWPALEEFNWVRDYFDVVAAGNSTPALRV